MNGLTRARRFSVRGALAALALAAAGCSSDGGSYYYYPSCEPGVAETSIDRAGFLDLDAGEGAGTTVEYAGDGAWRLAVACDTFFTGAYCFWEVVATPLDGEIDEFAGEGLEGADLLERLPPASSSSSDRIRMLSYTDYGIDAFTLLATPGSGMRVEAWLDGYCAGPFVYWVEDGEIVSSSTSATDFYPADP